MVRVSKRFSIEDYVDFFQNPQKHYLNKQHLNEILSIHGYVKLDVPRADLVEELKTLTMESPFRSTLKEKNTSASASLVNPDEIKEDLATIRWNEWSIDSAQIHRSGVEEERRYSMKFVESAEKSSKNKKQGLTDISNLPSAAAANLNSSNSKQQVQPKKKKKVSPGSDTPAVTTVQCLTDFPNLPPAANLNSSNSKQQVQPKKKKISPDSDTPAATTVQFLTDISNLPSAAANLNSSLNWWSNSKQQVEAKKKKKVSPDSDTPAATTVQGLTDITNLPLAPILNWSNSKQRVKPKKKKISPDMDMGGKRKKTENGALDLFR